MPPAFSGYFHNFIAQYKSKSLYGGIQVFFVIYAPPYQFQSGIMYFGIQSLF
jgi:hypothetical protein